MSKPYPSEAINCQRGHMPKRQEDQADQANPKHDPRGHMPNDHDQDEVDMTVNDHTTGESMTATAMPAPTHDAPNGDLMTADLDEPIPYTLRMITPEDAARAALAGVVGSLGHDEVRVLTRIAVRLDVGRRRYGRLHLASDARAFREKEAREEIEDALVYLACAWLKAEGGALGV